MKFDTLSIHAGNTPDAATGARQTPIYQSSSFVFKNAQHAADLFALKEVGYIYSRLTNPTIGALQERVAALHGGVGAIACASGHAAQMTALFNIMQSGDEFVASDKLYGGSINQFTNSFKQFGWKVNFVNIEDESAVRAAINDRTKCIFIESIANPGGIISDIEAVSNIAKEAGIPLIVDNTLATPYLCRPFEHGADIVVESTTKFLSGNGTSIGGIIVDSGKFKWDQNDKFPLMTEADNSYHGLKFYEACGELGFTFRSIAIGLRDLGAAMAPMNAFLTMLGIETLSLRMERHCQNAQQVAEFLSDQNKVEWVSYGGLKGTKYNKNAKKYTPKGAGAVLTFGVKGGDKAGTKLVESCKLFSHLANIGDAKSLIIHPSSTTHSQLPLDERIKAGAGPDVVRLSVGIEDIEDIIADLQQGLEQI